MSDNNTPNTEQAPAEEIRPQGWVDVQISADMPLSVIVNFLNVLNQRLALIEDHTNIAYGSKMISITDFYAIQAAEEAKMRAAQEEAAKQAAESKPETPDESKGA